MTASLTDTRPPLAPPRVGPDDTETASRERASRRRAAAVIALGCYAIIALSAWLAPATGGHGTHQQLGLPPCGWVVGFGIPCPTCGMTTAFAAAADGEFITSFNAQPMGLVLALTTAAVALVATFVAATGSALGSHILRLVTPRFGWFVAGLLIAAWVYKIVTFR